MVLSLLHTEPWGQQAAGPALAVQCPGREGGDPSFPLAASPAPLTSTDDARGISCVHRGEMLWPLPEQA